MQMFDQALLAAVQAREVDPDDAYSYATDKRLLQKFVTDTQPCCRKLDGRRCRAMPAA